MQKIYLKRRVIVTQVARVEGPDNVEIVPDNFRGEGECSLDFNFFRLIF